MRKLIDLSFIPEGKERDEFLKKLVATPPADRQRLMEQVMALYKADTPSGGKAN
jgi:hypothetical protein